MIQQEKTTQGLNSGVAWLKPPRALAVLLLVFVLVAARYSLAIPVGEGVDEVAHLDYVRYVRDQHALPIQPWRNNGQTMQVWMGHHPPLYYVLGAVVCFWCDWADVNTALAPNPHFTWIENNPTNGWNVLLHSSI